MFLRMLKTFHLSARKNTTRRAGREKEIEMTTLGNILSLSLEENRLEKERSQRERFIAINLRKYVGAL